MTDHVRIDYDGVDRAGKDQSHTNDYLHQLIDKLHRGGPTTFGLDQLQGCWGNDDLGKNFGNNYTTNAQSAVDGSNTVSQSFDNFPGILSDAVAALRDTDGANAGDVAQHDTAMDEQDAYTAQQLKNPPPA